MGPDEQFDTEEQADNANITSMVKILSSQLKQTDPKETAKDLILTVRYTLKGWSEQVNFKVAKFLT